MHTRLYETKVAEKRLFSWLYPLLAISLIGCATTEKREMYTARAVKEGADVILQENEVIIFGRILFTENGHLQIPYGFQTRPWWWLSGTTTSEPAAGQTKIHFTLSPKTKDDGTFIYIIPAGHHEITHIRPFYYVPIIVPALEFEAATPGIAYYLGDLEVDYDSTSWLGGLWGNYIKSLNYLEVIDRYDNAQAKLSAMMGNEVSIPVEKALMTRIRGQIPMLDQDEGAAWFGTTSPGTIKFGN